MPRNIFCPESGPDSGPVPRPIHAPRRRPRVGAWLALGACLSLGAACVDDPARDRDLTDDLGGGPGADATGGADAALDRGPADGDLDRGPADLGADVAPDGEVDAEGDAVVLPDLGPGEPETCNGLDDDLDGEIDEGVSNICGGCGGLPPQGCQAWRVDLTQTPAGTLTPDRVVAQLGGAIGFTEVAIEGATCEVLRVPGTAPDAHVGQVSIESPLAQLNLGPVFDELRGFHRYTNTPALGATAVHTAGDAVSVRAGGGALVGPFEFDLVAPAPLTGVAEADLEPVVDLAVGAADQPYTLRWDAAPSADSSVRLFVGGSRPIFRAATYRGTDSYAIEARLADDGRFDFTPELFGGGLPESAIRVDLSRDVRQRRALNGHSVSATIGQLVRLGRSGVLERDDPRPFQITEPSPNDPRIRPGEPVRIGWSPLPEGVGPLVVSLILDDAALPERRQVACRVDDPDAGFIVLPPELTAFWPTAPTDTRILAVRWDVFRAELPAPDRGTLTRSITLQFDLRPEPADGP